MLSCLYTNAWIMDWTELIMESASDKWCAVGMGSSSPSAEQDEVLKGNE